MAANPNWPSSLAVSRRLSGSSNRDLLGVGGASAATDGETALDMRFPHFFVVGISSPHQTFLARPATSCRVKPGQRQPPRRCTKILIPVLPFASGLSLFVVSGRSCQALGDLKKLETFASFIDVSCRDVSRLAFSGRSPVNQLLELESA
jgi:hypothetical protein